MASKIPKQDVIHPKKEQKQENKKIHSELGVCRDGKSRETRVDLRKSVNTHCCTNTRKYVITQSYI